MTSTRAIGVAAVSTVAPSLLLAANIFARAALAAALAPQATAIGDVPSSPATGTATVADPREGIASVSGLSGGASVSDPRDGSASVS
jgi:hypothetical protein